MGYIYYSGSITPHLHHCNEHKININLAKREEKFEKDLNKLFR